MSEEEGRTISFFEKFLPLWVLLCIVIGVLISQIIPGISDALNALKIGGISVPIGICLFLMMYPAMLNLKASELKKLSKNPKPIILPLPIANACVLSPLKDFSEINEKNGGQKKPTSKP